MMYAYNEDYESIVMRNLGRLFELACEEGMEMDGFATRFAESEVAHGIERGFPLYLAGKSAAELYEIIMGHQCDNEIPSPRGSEYWAGSVLAYSQRRCCRSFSDMLGKMSFTEIASTFYPLHEADITKVYEVIMGRMYPDNPVKERRIKKKLTQKDLATLAGLSLGTIRAYEQGALDLRKASAENIYMLSKVLGCTMEDLIL